ncbi:MAG: ABC transporter permease [Deltaproteobacteria bacterium]|nr:ABC transporter permease [Deltaproteobacteria bacterium]
MNILYYMIRRILQAIPLLLGIIIINFIIIHSVPGDPVLVIVGDFGTSPEYMEMMREKLGLNKPLYMQLFIYLKTILQGDLGYSFVWKEPVLKIILQFLPNTLLLMGASLFVAILLGIPMGVLASRKPYSIADNSITTLCLIGYSIPVFWLGIIGIIIFSVKLKWFPAQGMETVASGYEGFKYIWDVVQHSIMPVFVLSLAQLAFIARLTRASMLEVMGLDFIKTAWSKGLGEKRVIMQHGLRNAMMPIVTIIGLRVGYMFGGVILTETVFSWPGLGRLMLRSLTTRDYPLTMGLFIVITVLVIIVNFLTDLTYAILDPRVRYINEV